MEISKRTIEILKNFSQINQSIFYDPEKHKNSLVTKTFTSDIIAGAEIAETFPVPFAIYNINEFLSSLTMFDAPALDFEDKFVTIRENGSKRGGLKYFFANPALIVYPKNAPKAPPVTYQFSVKADQLAKIEKSAKILNVEDLVLVGDSEGVHAIITNKKNQTSNDFELTLWDQGQGDFKYYFKESKWRFINGNYNAILSVKETSEGTSGIGYFESEDGTIKYGVSMEKI